MQKVDYAGRRHRSNAIGAGGIPHHGAINKLRGHTKVINELRHKEEIAGVHVMERT